MLGYLSESTFVWKLIYDIIMWIVILSIVFYCIKRNPTDYDTNYRKRYRTIMGVLCILGAIGLMFINQKNVLLPNYYLSTFGTFTPNETMIQYGMGPNVPMREAGVDAVFALPTFEQWLILSKIKNFSILTACGLMFLFYKRSATRTAAKVRKVFGYFFLLFLVPAALDSHYFFDWEEFLFTGVAILIVWLLLRTYRKDSIAPTLPEESKQYSDSEDFAAIEPEEQIINDESIECHISDKEDKTLCADIKNKKPKLKTFKNLYIKLVRIFTRKSKDSKKKKETLDKPSKKAKVKIDWKIIKKVIFTILIIGILVGATCLAINLYEYYIYDYLPKKKRQEAIEQILQELQSSDEEIKRVRYIQILQHEPEWDIDGLENGSYPSEFLPLIDEAFQWFENKAYAGDSLYQITLATFYDNKTNEYRVKENIQKAAYWYQQAAENGFAYACAEIAMCYANGDGVEKDLSKAIYWFRRGTELNDPYSAYYLGNLYYSGVKQISGHRYETYKKYDDLDGGNRPNPEVVDGGFVVYCHEKVARRWDDNMYEWYNVYRKEVPIYKYLIKPDLEEAKELWRKAAAQGHQEAKDKLERIY